MKSVRDQIANRAINDAFQYYIDEIISVDELVEKLRDMYHPIVGKTPNECSPYELNIVAAWHSKHAEDMIRKAQDLVRAGHA